MDDSFASREEAVQQALHSAKQQIDILNATVSHLTAENGDLHRELDALKEQGQDDKVRLKSTSDICQLNEDKASDLTERLQLTVEEKEAAERLVEELTDQVTSLLEKAQSDVSKSTSAACACEADTATLQLQLEHLEGEMDIKKKQLSDAVADLQKSMEKNVDMKAEMEELGMEVECLQSQISSQCNIIQCQREELDGLRSQAESSSVCLDTNKKGNSLFSEVEDRRVMAETKMVRTMDKVNKLESRLKKEQKENYRLKNQVSLLMRSANNANDKTVRNLEQELEDSKRQALQLTQQLAAQQSEATKIIPTVPVVSSQPLSDSEVNMVTFLKATVANLQKEREAAIKEKNNLSVQNIQLDFLWTQKKNEVRSLTAEKERLAALTSHQALVIESLKSESDSTEDGPTKEMVKISNVENGCKEENDDVFGPLSGGKKSAGIGGPRNKENMTSQDLKSYILGTKSKSVAFSVEEEEEGDDDDGNGVLGDLGNRLLAEEEEESEKHIGGVGGDGKKGVKSTTKSSEGKSGGKYRSMTCVSMEDVQSEEQAPECNQQ